MPQNTNTNQFECKASKGETKQGHNVLKAVADNIEFVFMHAIYEDGVVQGILHEICRRCVSFRGIF